VTADATGARDELTVMRPPIAARQGLEIAGGHRAVLDRVDAADLDRLIVQPGASPSRLRVCDLAVHRRGRNAEDQAATMHERDLRREERILAHERFRAVDRVDEPQVLGIETALASLLAVEAVGGKTLRENAADHLL